MQVQVGGQQIATTLVMATVQSFLAYRNEFALITGGTTWISRTRKWWMARADSVRRS